MGQHLKKFCKHNFIRFKAMNEILKLREQITKLLAIHIHPLGYSLHKYVSKCTKVSTISEAAQVLITNTEMKKTTFHNKDIETVSIGVGDMDECLESIGEEEDENENDVQIEKNDLSAETTLVQHGSRSEM
uniref:Putative ATP-dependent RNA helicase PB1A10.06c n=1 Tax=Lygus hesperus TaxID=30085 RepID=A0A0A9W7L2_LYGHE